MSMSWRVVLQFQRLSLKIHKSLYPSAFKIQIMPYYAVARGRTAGIYHSWGDCEAQVKGYSGARYKKFDSAESAQDFININAEGGSGSAPQTIQNDNEPKYYPGTAKYGNLKRSYSTSSNNQNNLSNSNQSNSKPKQNHKAKRKPSSNDSDFDSDDSDDLNTMIMKQMDDIEKRVNQYGQGVDKIIKKNTSKSSGRQTILIEPPQPKRRRSANNNAFLEDSDGYVQVYTDGACSSNGRQGARAGIGVYWGDGHSLNTAEPVSGRATNNCGEIQAATHAVKQALQNGVTKLVINTDSQFLINSVTKWMPGKNLCLIF